ncbi:Bromodomain-containing protein [Venustampulla echinocandica]|uniref:Bromodomain-containing protein n=1 Tax=Venustampulla echinocandica TaxID=2656787 RepID=A0A370T9Y1_9HELO|nr:Bromodomain-containing protein [Venustampulla echinocandica]RDL30456.1 Bromodomain-containing protein [Venustampulla echinocandica]
MASEQSAPATDAPNVEPTPTIETSVEVKTEDTAIATPTPTATANATAGAEDDANATPSQTAPAPPLATGLNKQALDILDGIVRRLSDYKDPEDEHEVALPFQRMLNKRNFPTYFEIIKEPIALSTIRSKILKKQYQNYREFVRDFALICHNAMVYNRPSSIVYKDAVALQELFKAELQKLVEQKVLTEEEAELPDLGEIPPADPSPPPELEDEEPEEDEDESDEDEEDDGTDDDRPRGRRNKRGRRSSGAAKRDGKVDDDKKDHESQKKRGRPPKVHTPMEARISALLKGLRKFKNSMGDLKILHFEKLPDKSVMPEYYQEVKNPIAMDLIKRKAKRKKYQSVDQVLKDLELMFENAKSYNLDSSQVYKDAVDLQKEARIIGEQEKKKPDTDFLDEDGRLPLSEIMYNGELWKVGDWVHLLNPNDVTKPIVAQIFRTWQDQEGQKWINACWYYRPEQTVHRYEKHFYENEVVKTGQYRDSKIEEVVDRCFVMFFTRYNKGRPRGFPADKEVYVCEARYNEKEHVMNKIKTWASCVPDEVRDRDYEMDLFDAPRKMKKVPSPIKHLLREDAKEEDSIPKPTWGAPNAPPIVGAVHKRPRQDNESPPPEPTPSPPPPTPEPPRRSVALDRPRFDSQGDVAMSGTRASAPLPSPAASRTTAPTQYGQSYAAARPSPSPAPLAQQTSYGSHSSSSLPPSTHTPLYQQTSYTPQFTSGATPVAQHATPLTNYGQYQNSASVTPVRSIAPPPTTHTPHTNAYNPPRPVEVYTLSESANLSIPADIRGQFQQDEYGKVIFFTAPPLDINPIPEDTQKLGHSLRYLADKARSKEAEANKRKIRETHLEAEASTKIKRMKADGDGKRQWIIDQKLASLESWMKDMDNGTDELYKQLHGEKWKEVRDLDLCRLAVQQEDASTRKKRAEKFREESKERMEVKITGHKWI